MQLEVLKKMDHEQYYISIKNEGPYMDKLMIRKLAIIITEEYWGILENNNVKYDFNKINEKFSYFQNKKDVEKAIDELNGLLVINKLIE